MLSDRNGSLTLEVDIQHSELVVVILQVAATLRHAMNNMAFKVKSEDLQGLILLYLLD